MSSGGSVPYHLRPNKYVERRLFVELLGYIDKAVPLDDAVYMSMGGRYLEDHRLVHRRLRTERLLSIDADPVEVGRQLYNRPFPFIRCEEMSSEDLIDSLELRRLEHDPEDSSPLIVWLDYTDPRKLQEQLGEVRDLVAKLNSRDVVKVTLNASRKSLSDKFRAKGMSQDEVDAAAIALLTDRLGDFYSGRTIDPLKLDEEIIAQEIASAIEAAALMGTEGAAHLQPHVLSVFRYSDSHHQMVTVTFAIAGTEDWKNFWRAVKGWDFLANGWFDVHLINVPDLSVREQLHIATLLKEDKTDELVEEMEFQLDKNPSKTKAQLEEYDRHYGRYPTFVPVSF